MALGRARAPQPPRPTLAGPPSALVALGLLGTHAFIGLARTVTFWSSDRVFEDVVVAELFLAALYNLGRVARAKRGSELMLLRRCRRRPRQPRWRAKPSARAGRSDHVPTCLVCARLRLRHY